MGKKELITYFTETHQCTKWYTSTGTLQNKENNWTRPKELVRLCLFDYMIFCYRLVS
ncbi:hypothetical protein ACS0TY_030696 [Phlomoides rotata]